MAEQFKLGYRPALDGMRAFAVLAVLGTHASISGFDAGHLGVDVFFTLSGFLITSLLLEELREHDRMWLAGFWARRALRLVPALLVFLLVVWLAADWLWPNTRNGIMPALLYYMNWHMIYGEGGAGAITHTWSLAIEEQFYLLWPLALIGLWKLDRTLGVAIRVCTLVAAGSVVARVIVAQDDGRWYQNFFLRADGLLVGCILSLVVYSRGRMPTVLRGRWFAPVAIAGFLALMVYDERTRFMSGASAALMHLGAALATVALIVAVLSGTSPKVLAHPVAVWIGTRSYGIYLWHVVFMRNSIITVSSADVVWAFVLTFATAEVSYRFVELPFLRLKSVVRVRGERRAEALALARG